MENKSKLRYHMIIKGFVQGVNFRQFFKIKAQSISLFGWVKNLPSGDVEAVVEGTPQNYQQLEKWCYDGNHYAKVSKIETDSSATLSNFSSMEIVY